MKTLIDFQNPMLRHVLPTLLQDHTTGRNIIWATDPTPENWHCFSDEITLEKLDEIQFAPLVPRVQKRLAEQKERTRKKAEVFTPTEVCNKMIDLALRESNLKEDDWENFIDRTWVEAACGEAPFLVSRYDTVTGQPIAVSDRIGILDRKLKAVARNFKKYPANKPGAKKMEWSYNRLKSGLPAMYFEKAVRAFESVYGYEWQGDSLLLARSNLLLTYCEHYRELFKKDPGKIHIEIIAEIIAWNVWQMDGLKNTVPGTDIPCKVYDWRKSEEVLFWDDGRFEDAEEKTD